MSFVLTMLGDRRHPVLLVNTQCLLNYPWWKEISQICMFVDHVNFNSLELSYVSYIKVALKLHVRLSWTRNWSVRMRSILRSTVDGRFSVCQKKCMRLSDDRRSYAGSQFYRICADIRAISVIKWQLKMSKNSNVGLYELNQLLQSRVHSSWLIIVIEQRKLVKQLLFISPAAIRVFNLCWNTLLQKKSAKKNVEWCYIRKRVCFGVFLT